MCGCALITRRKLFTTRYRKCRSYPSCLNFQSYTIYNRMFFSRCRMCAQQQSQVRTMLMLYYRYFLYSFLCQKPLKNVPMNQQKCIPVGCVPPACCPYLPACTAHGGCTHPGGMYLPGVYLPGGVPAWGVYLPRGCVPARGGGVPAQGVYLPGGTSPTPCEQNDRQVQKYYLAPNFVCGR